MRKEADNSRTISASFLRSDEILEKLKVTLEEVKKNKSCYALIAPMMILFTILVAFPIINSLYLSCYKFSPMETKFVGLQNYISILKDPLFWIGLKNTLYIVIGAVPLVIVISLIIALLVNTPIRFKNFFRLIFFLPYLISMVAIAVVWKWMYDPLWGLINPLIGYLGISPKNWLGDPSLGLFSIIVLIVWKSLGYNMILFLAGLQSIPEHFYEAAKLDGAGRWVQFLHITLPLLRPVLLFILVMSTIFSFQIFDSIYVMTGGGPVHATKTIAYLIYTEGFIDFRRGRASSLACFLALIIFALSYLEIKYCRSEVEY